MTNEAVRQERGLCQGRPELHGDRERTVFVLGDVRLCTTCVLLLFTAAKEDFEQFVREHR